MNTSTIAKGLEKHPENQVENYIAYLNRLLVEKNKQGQLKNPWMINKKEPEIIRFFETVASDGLVFDGIDITLQSTGVSYSYQAYKNKMFIAYPESIIDVNLVYKGDAFNFSKNSGQVNYTHAIDNPFGHNDVDIIGAYCVIKNKRGQFLTTLSRPEIDKHRKVAKTDYIWQSWFPEMCMKTVIKKACKQHFKDTYHNIEILDNENYDLDKIQDDTQPPKITIGQENLNWLIGFCKNHNIVKDETKKEFQKHYKFSPYGTTPNEFEAIKTAIELDYSEET
jgi:hypothetical protein